MRQFFTVIAFLSCSFLGGAFAQPIVGFWYAAAAPTIFAGIQFVGNMIYAGASGANNSWMFMSGPALSGTASPAPNGFISPFNLYIGSDTVDTTTSGNGSLTGFLVEHASSVGHTGIREAIKGYEAVVGVDGTGLSHAHVGVTGITRMSAQMGGSTGAYQNYIGNGFGGNSNVFSASGATFLQVFNAHEFDVSLVSGSSAAEKHGATIVQAPGDAVRAVFDDSALEFTNAGSATWAYGISLGSYAGGWPFATDSTLIGAQTRQAGGSSSPVALYGIDFSAVTFSAGGAPILSSLITPASSSAACKQGGLVWDASFIYVCTIANTWKRAALAAF